MSFKNHRPSETLAYLPIVKRIDSHTIRYVGDDLIKIADFLEFLMEYNSVLEP